MLNIRAMKYLSAPLLLLWSLPSVAADRPISSCGTVITEPGNYKLVQDLDCTSPLYSAIIIRASNVRLSMNHHTIRGDDQVNSGIAVFNQSNVKIYDHGTISHCLLGILLNNTDHSSISDLNLTENQYGITLDTASSNKLSDLVIRNEFGGILVLSSNDNEITDNTVSGHAYYGMILSSASQNTVRSNTVRQNRDGIIVQAFVGPESLDNTINDNTVESNVVGISLTFGSRDNTLRGNTALRNAGYDLWDLNTEACLNDWDDNRFLTDNEVGAGAGPGGGCIQ